MIARVIHCGLCKCIHSGLKSRAVALLKPYLRRWTQARMQQSQQFLATPLCCRLLELLFGLPLFRLCTAQLLCPAQVAWKALCLLSQHAAVIVPLPTPLNDFSEKRQANGWRKSTIWLVWYRRVRRPKKRHVSHHRTAPYESMWCSARLISTSAQCVQFIIYERLYVCVLRAISGKRCSFCDLILT